MAIGDQYFDKVVLACTFDKAIKDEPFLTRTEKPLTANGNVVISSNQYKSGGASAYFDGSGDWISAASSLDFNFGSGDLTIETWVYQTARPAPYPRIFQFNDNWSTASSWCLLAGHGDFAANKFVLHAYAHNANISPLLISTTAIAFNTWYHVAVTRSGSTWRMFVNGVLEATATWAGAVDTGANTCNIGIVPGAGLQAGSAFAGYLDGVRITRGVCRYTGNFTPYDALPLYAGQIEGTVKDANGNFAQRLVRAHRRTDGAIVSETLSNPSTGAFTLNCPDSSKHYAVVHDSDAWITYLPFNGDNNATVFPEWSGKAVTRYGDAKISTAQSKFGGASLYLDGAGDYLTLPVSNEYSFGTGDFTVECWVRPEGSFAGLPYIFHLAGTPYANNRFTVYLTASGKFALYAEANGGVTVNSVSGSQTVTIGNWYHVALVRSNGTTYLYVNGVSDITPQSAQICTSGVQYGLYIGSAQPAAASNYFNGYIDDLKISKGKAQYVGNFIPASVPHFTEQSGDPYWNNVVLAMHMDGQPDNGDQYRNNVVLNMRGNDLTDDTGKAVTVAGNTNVATVSGRTAFGGKAISFDGAGDYLSIGSVSGSVLSSDFTVEFWLNLPAIGTKHTIVHIRDASNTGLNIEITTAGKVQVNNSQVGTTDSSVTLSANTWYHIAVVRSGSTITGYINGASTLTHAAQSYGTTTAIEIGRIGSAANNYLNGFVDDLRITQGTARYTTTFTPPTAEIPALQRRFPDVKSGKVVTANGDATISSAQSKFGGYSAYFDGSGDYLSLTLDAFGTSDFTVEAWIYVATIASGFMLLDTRSSDTDFDGFAFYVRSTGKVTIFTNGAATEGVTNVVANTWNHVALTRSGGVIRGFLNGNQEFSLNYATAFTKTSSRIGSQWNGGTWSAGYVDDMRISLGLARYVGAFTPATAPFPETLQTYGQQNAMIYDHLTPV